MSLRTTQRSLFQTQGMGSRTREFNMRSVHLAHTLTPSVESVKYDWSIQSVDQSEAILSKYRSVGKENRPMVAGHK